MKHIIILFIALISFASCQKKNHYECKIYTAQNINGSEPVYFFTQSQSDKFIRENTVTTANGDVTTVAKCIKK